jgi:hypothetical protein
MNHDLKRIVSLVNDNSVDDLVSLFDHANANETQVGGSHYAGAFQHWDFMGSLKPSWPEGCMSKYLCRVFKKNGLQDVEKVLHYCYKLMQEVHLGISAPPTGLTEAQRADLYIQFYRAQDLKAPTQDLQNCVRDCFRHLSSWESLRDLRIVFQSVCDLHARLSSYTNESIAPSVVDTSGVDPVSGPVEPGSSPDASYVQQDASPKNGPTTEQNVDQLIRSIVSNAVSILPIQVYSKVLEDSRRNSTAPIDLRNFNNHPAFCRDYSEGGLKLELALSHLRESLPNQQSLRTSLAMACLVDGVSSLICWSNLRPGSPPVNPVPLLTEAATSKGITFSDLMEYMYNAKTTEAT